MERMKERRRWRDERDHFDCARTRAHLCLRACVCVVYDDIHSKYIYSIAYLSQYNVAKIHLFLSLFLLIFLSVLPLSHPRGIYLLNKSNRQLNDQWIINDAIECNYQSICGICCYLWWVRAHPLDTKMSTCFTNGHVWSHHNSCTVSEWHTEVKFTIFFYFHSHRNPFGTFHGSHLPKFTTFLLQCNDFRERFLIHK